MSSEVKRYDISGFGGGMVESQEGAWYHMDDYAALAAELEAARKQEPVIELPDPEKYYHDTETAQNVIRDCRAAIEAAGLKVKP